jgi:hypothetical protein
MGTGSTEGKRGVLTQPKARPLCIWAGKEKTDVAKTPSLPAWRSSGSRAGLSRRKGRFPLPLARGLSGWQSRGQA